ncbi:MAG: excinuclease ABC subunit UvrC [Planctomycetia bacterium]|nr:excinuclease ABC subunit UvrC [Planctomycetia bacterium]
MYDFMEYPNDNSFAAERVKEFPHAPGVYLMKDAQERVIYIGKAKDLRKRAGSYFLKTAAEDERTRFLVRDIRDIDFIQTPSEVDAIIMEARLIKDIQPKYNRALKDGKSFPYIQVHYREEFPRVEATREPLSSGVKLYGPYISPIRGALVVIQKIFKFRTCQYDIQSDDPKMRFFRPCLLASIGQCTAPCCGRTSKEEYRKQIHRLQRFLEGNRDQLLEELRSEMKEASKNLQFENAAAIRDQISALERLNECGDLETHVQPEVFQMDPKKGLLGLQKILHLPKTPRVIEGVDIAHLQGEETVASLVQFIDGLPFKAGYKRYRIRSVDGVNDFASIGEVVYRRLRRLREENGMLPDIFLIDGGKGQLHSAADAAKEAGVELPALVSLAKREEEVFVWGREEPLHISRHAFSLRLLQYVRDEAHRFAQHYHHLLRRKKFRK